MSVPSEPLPESVPSGPQSASVPSEPLPASPASAGPQPVAAAVPQPAGSVSAGPLPEVAAPAEAQPVAVSGPLPDASVPAEPQPVAASGPLPDASVPAEPQPVVPSGAEAQTVVQPDDAWPPPEPLAATRVSVTVPAAGAPATGAPEPTATAAPAAEAAPTAEAAPAAEAPAPAAPAPLPAATPMASPEAEASGAGAGAATLQLTKVEPEVAHAAGGGAPAVADGPRHPKDPYGTPPYGDPGPWAPAPPVQRPVTTPAHGTPLPPPGAAPVHGSAAPPLPPQAPYVDRPLPAERPVAPQPYPQGGNGTDGGGFVPRPGDGGPRSAVARSAALPVADAPLPPERPVPHPDASGDHGRLVPAHPGGAWQQYDPWSPPGQAAQPPVRRARRGPLVVGAVVLALLAGGVGGAVGVYVERHGGPGDIILPQADEAPAPRDPHSVAGIAQSALPGVVTLHVRGNAEQGTGTGFVLDRQGRILTNNHVVEPAGNGGEISVTFSGGQTAKARVVGRDSGYDLAVVQVDNVSGLHPLALGNSDAVRVGDPVVAIGAPYDLANTVTAGIISAKQRPITAGGEKGDGSDVSYVDALQTDAPINPGNSGGPLVDGEGRVIGINSAIRAADGSSPDGTTQGGSIGLGFAIPINQAKRVAEELINTGRATHPVIGVTLEMEYPGDGARVSGVAKDGRNPVTPGGPGAKAGIKGGDVITRLDGAPVHSGEELIVKIRSHRPGDALTLTLRRGGKDRTVHLTLGSSGTG
ncbi:trypsin-like peptidase domain-containing protein [Streptomyces catenulae]|uniref:S1C family serine protease n=1 Tax=Streptomyces catenulae TaxID=66875 RepID=UPI003CCBF653